MNWKLRAAIAALFITSPLWIIPALLTVHWIFRNEINDADAYYGNQ